MSTPLVARFQRSRWSPVRRRLDALAVRETITLPIAQRDAVRTNIARLREAYADGRQYRTATTAAIVIIERTA